MRTPPSSHPPYRRLTQRLFARCVASSRGRIDERHGALKRELFGALTGTVLEIGPGTGANLPYLPPDVRWIGIEPNPYMHPYLHEEAAQLGRTVEVRQGVAEELTAPDASVDAVVCTLVLCSVHDPAQVLREVRRVLRPGGRFVFIEHVAARRGTWQRRAQDLVQPLWTPVGEGCHPNRETWLTIEAAGFDQLDLVHFDIGVPFVGPHIAGVGVK
ncbi:MAG: class I SAM-dependent methyltransferase [Anaerolineae bacterium]|nr:class I SAM-dependent methyltransferase [Anaerolineae bacterium]